MSDRPWRVPVTGHRPDKLGGYSLETMKRLGAFARLVVPRMRFLAAYCPAGRLKNGECFGGCNCAWASCHVGFMTGMAQGWDQAVAAACADLGIPFDAAVPFVGQESRWPAETQRAYNVLLKRAAHVYTLADAPKTNQEAVLALNARNLWMLERAEGLPGMPLLALWNGSPGGTRNTVHAAQRAKVQIVNVWDLWQRFLRADLRERDIVLRVAE